MNKEIIKQEIITNFNNLNGEWVNNRDNYDKYFGDILGWKCVQQSRYDLITKDGDKIEIKKCKNAPIWKLKQLSEAIIENKSDITILVLKTNKNQTKIVEVRAYNEYELAKLIIQDKETAEQIINLVDKLDVVIQKTFSFKKMFPAELWCYKI